MNTQEKYKSLIESVKLLAAPYEIQVKSLPSYVDVPFEVVTIFEDAFYLLPEIIMGDYFSKVCIADIISLFLLINIISKDENLCNNNALAFDNSWISIRNLAQKILTQTNELDPTPHFTHIKWVKGGN